MYFWGLKHFVTQFNQNEVFTDNFIIFWYKFNQNDGF